jgi:hypothetical protein
MPSKFLFYFVARFEFTCLLLLSSLDFFVVISLSSLDSYETDVLEINHEPQGLCSEYVGFIFLKKNKDRSPAPFS